MIKSMFIIYVIGFITTTGILKFSKKKSATELRECLNEGDDHDFAVIIVVFWPIFLLLGLIYGFGKWLTK